MKLEVNTDPLPPELNICQAAATLEYTQVRMNNVDFLLPFDANMRIVNSDGSESRNRTSFSSCHQFLGESKLILEDRSAAGQPVSGAKPQAVVLPGGLQVAVALAQPIDPKEGAAGDPVAGRLTKMVKDSVSNLIIPKGAKLNGRIYELRSTYSEATFLEFGLKWESVELNGAQQPLNLLLKLASVETARLPLHNGNHPKIEALFRPDEPGVGFLVFSDVTKDYRIPSGFEAVWMTLPREPSAK